MNFKEFNKQEREFLLHRLEAPEAIAEALTDTDESRFSFDQVEHEANLLRVAVEQLESIDSTPLQIEVLQDAVDGATYGYVIKDGHDLEQLTSSQYYAKRKAIQTCTEKLNAAGIKCECPWF